MAKMALQKRERVLLIGGTILVVLVAAYIFGKGPWEKYKASAATLAEARDRVKQVARMRDAVIEARQSEEVIQARLKERGGFDLYTAIKDALRNAKLLDRGAELQTKKAATSDKFSAVQLNLEGVSMEELVGLLYAIYSANDLVVLRDLQKLTPAEDRKGLACQMTFISPKS